MPRLRSKHRRVTPVTDDTARPWTFQSSPRRTSARLATFLLTAPSQPSAPPTAAARVYPRLSVPPLTSQQRADIRHRFDDLERRSRTDD